jgi:threonylcarbamoyladenosine tRNA methylthiotransferase MtaB
MPHFHMPLQSGSNEILKLMRRRYLRELYQERVLMIKNQMPHACIGVDVISGFPGETDQHFQDTFDFLHDLDIDYIHPFSYSEREDTPAASMPGKVAINIRRYRSQVLRDLSSKKKSGHYTKHFGEFRKVLFEKGPTSKTMSGFTDNYIRIIAPLHPDLINTIQTVELNSIIEHRGELYTTLRQLEVADYLSFDSKQ